jgi:hypothetical protein
MLAILFYTTKTMNEIIAVFVKDLESEILLRAPAPLLPPWEKGLGDEGLLPDFIEILHPLSHSQDMIDITASPIT